MTLAASHAIKEVVKTAKARAKIAAGAADVCGLKFLSCRIVGVSAGS